MLVRKHHLGRKNGKGFYEYASIDANPAVVESITQLISPYQKDDSFQGSIVDRILAAMLIAASNVASEEIVADPRDVDVAMIHGLGFPTHLGGLLFWAGLNASESLKTAVSHELDRHNESPTPLLREWLSNGNPFYQTV
ncbi:MAG: 3-hydroxyacyl-CoA dehydrogenase family protein [Pirellulaceae bacterium]